MNGAMLSSLERGVFEAGTKWVTTLQSRPDGERFYGAGIFFQPFMKNAFNTTLATKGVWPPPGHTTLSALAIVITQPDSMPGHAEENARHLRDCVEQVNEAAKKSGIQVLNNYPNYLLAGSPPEEFYDEDTLMLLRAVKRKYDPEDLFNKGIHVGV